MTAERSLTGRRALVTGAASDIGDAVCSALRTAGAEVTATDLPGDRLRRLAVDGVRVAPADLCDLGQVTTLCTEPVDVLVSVAGLAHVERFADSDPADWERLWQINLRAPMLLTRGLLEAMVRGQWGRLVYVASDTARAGAAGEAVYAATKAGLLGFAKSIAREAAAAGVTANVICPGVIDTERSRAILTVRPRLSEALLRSIPARRLGSPADVAASVAYLCSPDAAYVTGQTVSVNGGITMS